MIEFAPFRAGHLAYLTPQKAQEAEYKLLRDSAAEALEGSVALSAWANNRCLGAAGLIPIRPHRAIAWMILSERASPYMLPIVRKVRRVISASAFKRVELTVSDRFEEGHRFARMLGAVRETPEPMKYFGADGGDEVLYAVLKTET